MSSTKRTLDHIIPYNSPRERAVDRGKVAAAAEVVEVVEAEISAAETAVAAEGWMATRYYEFFALPFAGRKKPTSRLL